MKAGILSMALIVAVAATGCLKNNQQPVDTSAAVKAILIGSWTGTTSNIAYYDATGNEAGSATLPSVNLNFDSQSNITETTTGTTPTTLSGTYSVITDATGSNYLVTSGGVGNHTYAIASASSGTLSLYEQLAVTTGATTTINGKSVTYYSTIQISSYSKN
jgi:hypothetical protein